MIVSLSGMSVIREDLKKEGLTVVFTNGVFDVIHRGHIEYLNKAKDYGDILIVGVNSDSSVKRLKGDTRPINCESDRLIVVDCLKPVDYTVLFDTDTPYDMIKSLIPDILVKGADYDPLITDNRDKRYIVGSDIVKASGGKVVAVELVPGRSSTDTINKLRQNR
ncbi:TPA: D-glycero-beta-D-manno-heptose 1-phosphate adenylyltransferase [Candidatus Delongbacteria bacterium]|nr:D-glycero-beta-D-manno-heptose 1-phosphate adenylyltransferase [Candidatus Delongbacteria bacterium]